ncbi:MAG: 2-succinyl-5-enolpyruvyl-6-hydroxy-3-cyclohexene-1-carboxylic-acid synthase [Deltaproteobacteria bacterium]|nr:2-succinyl-5-enolpyruvyl-6-hydroxy-3-cyclohexene-1-carboxylic-acid synthase [Deltaproteobacteria bacterium]
MIQAANVNHLWATLLVEELVRNGIDTFCIAPGSRSTPLVVAAARNPRARAIVHYDERGAAFHALGHGRATGSPAVVVTTSGSALANVWPAVVEASLERVPLLVLSGDRPPELQDAGANQTMDQVKFFGGYAEWSASLPCPSTDVDPAVVLTTVDQAVSRCRGPAGGAVHVNCMFREPLAPTEQGEDFEAYLEPVRAWHEGGHAYTRHESAPSRRAPELSAELVELVARRPRGLLLAGGLASAAERAAVADLAQALGWPFLPDVTSGLRLEGKTVTLVPYHEVLLGSTEFMRDHPVEAVIHVGGRWTSRRLPDHLEVVPPKDYVVVNEQPDRVDPIHRATLRFRLPVAEFCEALRALVGNGGTAVDAASGAAAKEAGGAPDTGWLASWRQASEHVGGRLDELLTRDRTLNEPKVARLVSRHIGGGEGLYLASSMPVRDMDTFGCPRPDPVVVAANRGASGVDGTIATATGFARGLGKCVTLVIGDQAFLHDLNSLGLCRSLDHPFVIVVLNNDGGGIFSFLPIARFQDVFEPYFGASHGMTFEHAAALFGLEYARPSTADEFVDAYAQARGRGGATVIEVRTARQDNVDLHASLRREALEGLTLPSHRT